MFSCKLCFDFTFDALTRFYSFPTRFYSFLLITTRFLLVSYSFLLVALFTKRVLSDLNISSAKRIHVCFYKKLSEKVRAKSFGHSS